MPDRDFDELSITRAVVDRFADTPDPRLKRIVQALVRHAHEFVRYVELTEDEWMAAIQFLTRVGQISDDKRQEGILLSDIFGVSMLVDAINHRMPQGVTETTVLGPYLDSDAVFGVKQSLIVSLTSHGPGPAPGRTMTEGWKSLDHTFGLKSDASHP